MFSPLVNTLLSQPITLPELVRPITYPRTKGSPDRAATVRNQRKGLVTPAGVLRNACDECYSNSNLEVLRYMLNIEGGVTDSWLRYLVSDWFPLAIFAPAFIE